MTRSRVVWLFVAVFATYLGVGLYLAVGVHLYFGDALSRVQSAQAVLFSRSPHLAAIGFVFTPLTAIAQLPLTAVTPWIPQMTTDAVSAVIMSAAFMAGSVVQVSGVARDRGIDPVVATLVTACYALNPMIILYGANGMSEAPYLFFLAWAARRLMRWVDTDDVHELAVAGIALALGYLTRYDGGAAASVAALVVAWVSFRRADREKRFSRTVLDVVLVESPSALAFIGWAFAGWLITGNAFAQFSSEYGNASIIEESGGSGSDGVAEALRFSMTELAILAPLLPLLAVIVLVLRARHHRLYAVLVPLAVIGAVLLFQIYTYTQGSTFGFLRFYITVILLAALVALLAVPARQQAPFRRLGPRSALRPDWTGGPTRRYVLSGAVAVLVMLVSLPTTVFGMSSQKYAPQEYALASVVWPRPDSVSQRYLDERRIVRSFSTEAALAHYLDSLDLPDGSVLTDTVYGFAVVVQSVRPKQFVIPSDPDFTEILNSPKSAGVQYMLAVPDEGRGVSDALNQRYPTLYDNGAQVAVRVLDVRNQGADLPDWRVYRVTGSSAG
ncbi:ArnT family glycosyltransferase [Gordonia sp. DT30]|uniref:ArnT family glycosyltransferase n=1 Tax=unclassified Gordonia (in: high G+C Gram-positive bacteria) TaxID=2657482 RepID=UPI003CF72FC7